MMYKQLLFLEVFVCLVAISTTTTIMPPKTTPASEWGSYYRTELDLMTEAFSSAFAEFKRSDSRSDSICSQTDVSGSYVRYYQNIDEAKANQYILSYYCIRSRSYEHLRVNIGDINDKSTANFVEFHHSLGDLGITGAGDYEDVNTDAKAEVEEFFNQYKVQLTDSLPDGCRDPTWGTIMTWASSLQTKEENALTYWMFPVTCTLRHPKDYYTEIELFQDKTNYYVNDGKIGFVGASSLISQYHLPPKYY